jgi:hypothetical protein
MDAIKKEAPNFMEEAVGAETDLCQNKSTICFDYKDTKFADNPIRQKLFEVFLSGEKFSVVQLVVTFRIPDPRSHIRYIRNAGVPISDYWVITRYSRYKVYFLKGVDNE